MHKRIERARIKTPWKISLTPPIDERDQDMEAAGEFKWTTTRRVRVRVSLEKDSLTKSQQGEESCIWQQLGQKEELDMTTTTTTTTTTNFNIITNILLIIVRPIPICARFNRHSQDLNEAIIWKHYKLLLLLLSLLLFALYCIHKIHLDLQQQQQQPNKHHHHLSSFNKKKKQREVVSSRETRFCLYSFQYSFRRENNTLAS